jgi:hypothetical protein
LDASLVRGSHGGLTPVDLSPVFITQRSDLLQDKIMLEATNVYNLIWEHLFM